jgi:hypothetical protein
MRGRSIRVKLARGAAQAPGLEIEGAGALVFALTVRERSAAMAAKARRNRCNIAGGTAATIARKLDDIPR